MVGESDFGNVGKPALTPGEWCRVVRVGPALFAVFPSVLDDRVV